MNSYGNNALLWLAEADARHPAGTMAQIAPRLVKGYVRGLASLSSLPESQFRILLAVCVQTYRDLGELRAPSITYSPSKRLGDQTQELISTAAPIHPIRIIAHVQMRGDTDSDAEGWAGISNSHLAIEGFTMLETGSLPPGALTYQVLFEDLTYSQPAYLGEFCGTTGLAKSVFGFVVFAHSHYAGKLRIACEARFVDGTILGPVEAGVLCKASSGAALEGLRVCSNYEF